MRLNSNQQRHIESHFPFISRLEPDIHDELIAGALPAHVPKGHMVCQEGTHCPHLALMLSGTARVYKLGENGRDITLYRVRAGQSCILTASCILSDSAFPAFAECEEDVDAVLLPSPQVRHWIARSQVFRDYVFGLMAQRLGNLIHTVEEVVFHRLDQRLAAYLYGRFESSGDPLLTTHQDIASDLGTSREVISRLLKDFESRKLIHTRRGSIELLNLNGLNAKRK